MSASTLRFCNLNETTSGEPDQDANSAFTELDKGVRSGKIGEQCEAIVKFPKLFEKFPFPILINSSFLKLADVFRNGNNFLRLWVVKVCQQSEQHFDKIINVDDFVRKIFGVIHSNDPIARALTLRTLGSVAGIIPEYQNVHHSIRTRLDSHNAVEVEAAIFAATQFAAKSRSFAISVCNKISDMIQGMTTPVHMKLQLIPILKHMHHDTATSAMVRSLCTDLLTKYPAQDFVVVTLKTLTQLAAATLVDVPEQVKLLVKYVAEEPRWIVRMTAQCGLYTLAQHGSYYWSEEAVADLIIVARFTDTANLAVYIFDILVVLTKSPAICQMYYKSDSPLMEFCYEIAVSHNPEISGKAVKIISQIACYCYNEKVLDDVEQNVNFVVSYLLFLSCNESVSEDVLKFGLQNAVALCCAEKGLCSTFVDVIASNLLQNPTEASLSWCKALCAIGSLNPAALRSFTKEINLFLCKISSKSVDDCADMKSTMCTLLLQSAAGHEESDEIRNTMDIVIENSNLWTCYRMARSAGRYGHFGICNRITSKLRDRVSSEHLHFWLSGLQEISIAEANLQSRGSDTLLNNISNSIINYCKAMSSFKAACTQAFTLSFQNEFTRMRYEMLLCFSSLLATCNCFSPPPVIAARIVQNTKDELQRYGQITNQLRKRASELKQCAEMYWNLYQKAFDADPISLLNIKALQYMCAFMANNVELMTSSSNQIDETVLDHELQDGPLEIQLMVNSCKEALRIKQSMSLSPKIMSHKHIECLIEQASTIILTPMCYPRYFFQALQSTDIKLSVLPQPRSASEHVSINGGTYLTVKVEGVLQHGVKGSLFRKAAGIVLTVNTTMTQRGSGPSSHDAKGNGDVKLPVLTQSVKPHRDFFKSEFLLGFTVGGQYQMVVDAAITDENAFTWQTGTKSTLNIKVHEEGQSVRARTVVS